MSDRLKLLLAFRKEQSDPDRFYRMLAADTAALVGRYRNLKGARVVDVGSGPGDLVEAFRIQGAWAVAVDSDWKEMHCRDRALMLAVLADGRMLPFADATFQVTCSSNVLEHTDEPASLLRELVRITEPGGIVFFNYTAWLSPWGGHETAPWHYLGGHWAARRYERVHRRPPKNVLGKNLFPLGVGEVLDMARGLERSGLVQIQDAFPRYLPPWARPLVKVAGLREILTWNMAVVLVRSDRQER